MEEKNFDYEYMNAVTTNAVVLDVDREDHKQSILSNNRSNTASAAK